MNSTTVALNPGIEAHIRCVVPVKLSQDDLEYFVSWFVQVGIETVRAALEEHPELTLGDFIQFTMHKH